MATSHFYHDSYFCRFCSVYNLTLLLLTFDLWFVTSKLQWLQHAFPAINERDKLAGRSEGDFRQDFIWKVVLSFGLGDSMMASVA